MKIRFFNARILPLDGTTPLFTGELVVTAERSSLLANIAAKRPFDREIDCKGNLLMPGFKTRIRIPA
jgi:5-methylthioadenosine/S-adenosylhomocysteine deaminase